jgi:hypothetical protein
MKVADPPVVTVRCQKNLGGRTCRGEVMVVAGEKAACPCCGSTLHGPVRLAKTRTKKG